MAVIWGTPTPVSYTHLDVYKRQVQGRHEENQEKHEVLQTSGERLRHGVHPVSYTHLDVYKRQQFTVADGYLYTVLGWCQWVGIDIKEWPALAAFSERVAGRPSVTAALAAEAALSAGRAA